MSSSHTINIQALLENHRAQAYSNIAAYTLLIEANACGTQLYDHFLNLGEEIDLIWSTVPFQNPSFSQINRHLAVVLVFRTWAVWGKNSKVMISLLFAALLMACPTGYFVYHGLSSTTFGPSPSGVDYVCWMVTPAGNIIFLDYIVVVIFETIILVLTILKCLQHREYCLVLAHVNNTFKISPGLPRSQNKEIPSNCYTISRRYAKDLTIML
ncbi:hypothetical protein BU17DRAFT_67640 [Hysterangium stoloniferum]|nr:hypothetical protein BU17DRAFT_67640 [Hysterangium stoloniferum]